MRPAWTVLAESNVIRNEKVYSGQAQGFLQGKQLIGVKSNAGSERGLQEIGIRQH